MMLWALTVAVSRRRSPIFGAKTCRHLAQSRASHPGADRRSAPGLPAPSPRTLRSACRPATLDGTSQPVAEDPGWLPSPLLYLGYVGSRDYPSPSRPCLRAGRRAWRRGAAVDSRPLVVYDARHRAGQLVGLLHSRLGRLLVLGSRSENESLMPWLAGTRCCIRHRRREARLLKSLDGAFFGHSRFSLFPARHLLGFRRTHLGARLASDPARGCSIIGLPAGRHWRRTRAYAWRAPKLMPAGCFNRRREGSPDPETTCCSARSPPRSSGHAYPLFSTC